MLCEHIGLNCDTGKVLDVLFSVHEFETSETDAQII